ncbi:Integrase core domain-containing protein [Geodermatophilus obscurus]|uniref:Integrase core domain-containing protein n=1 Tax=Geodermatophilus obscurus TaxID=1861 RepID=A0A1I5HNX4_9ACTN|nr:Integrase core domain-containing protein [Geodermatophilus obscurus]
MRPCTAGFCGGISGSTSAHNSSLISRGGGEDTDDEMPRTLRRHLVSGQSPRTYFRNIFLDNAMIESSWSSMQIELLDRQKWRTRVELANTVFDYIEIFHDRRRRHSQLGYRTPIEHGLAFPAPSIPA